MGRSSRDQRGQFSTMVRVDGRGRIVPGSNILKKGQKPKDGKWQKKSAYECCDPLPIVGTFYQGGIIGSSTIINNQVMIVDLNDLGSDVWSNNLSNTGATGKVLKTGESNTDAIISSEGVGSYAASLCRAGIFDWDLPSEDELNQVFINRILINSGISNNGGTAIELNGFYWSSSERFTNNSYRQNFFTGNQSFANKTTLSRVRAVRWVNIS